MTGRERRDPSAWTIADAERYLLALELFGMRFGLQRMRRLMTALGSPQGSFDAIHVVGTNGKSSTTRMIAAILREHGLRTGSYLSPHLVSFAERVRVDDEDSDPEDFAAAVRRAAHAAAVVNRTARDDDRVTQFEALTAAAYDELARREVEVAAVEAGLGGRFDATSVVGSAVQVLTNVGLEHTRWLGPTIADIAREKLAVVPDGGVLVVGAGLHPDAAAEARATAAARGARLIEARADLGIELAAQGSFQRANFALAQAAAEAYLGELDGHAVRRAAAAVTVPGRMQVVDRAPLTIFDGAHNPAGAAALAASLPELLAGAGRGAGAEPLVVVVSILEDKDAAGILAPLLGRCAALICAASANPRALPPATLASLAGQVGGDGAPPCEIVPDPHAALERARELAGRGGAVLATGSIYLVADLVRPAGTRRASTL